MQNVDSIRQIKTLVSKRQRIFRLIYNRRQQSIVSSYDINSYNASFRKKTFYPPREPPIARTKIEDITRRTNPA